MEMFLCECGGVLVATTIERYPLILTNTEKLEYERKCNAECLECGKTYGELQYD
jgi:hypothetical protein